MVCARISNQNKNVLLDSGCESNDIVYEFFQNISKTNLALKFINNVEQLNVQTVPT